MTTKTRPTAVPVKLQLQDKKGNYYPSSASVEQIFNRFLYLTTISKNRLDTLIEAPGAYTWRWINGVARPGRNNLVRVLEVASESLDGGDISKYGAINWETGEVRQMNKDTGSFEVIAELPPEDGLDSEQTEFDRPARVLARLLKILGISQKAAERLLGTSNNGMYRWLNSRSSPSPYYLLRLLELANLALEGYDLNDFWKIDWDTGVVTTQAERTEKDTDVHEFPDFDTDIPTSRYSPR